MHRLSPVTGLIVAAALFGGLSTGRVPQTSAQDAGTASAPASWQIQADNVSPPGHNWSFNTYYPDHLQAHPGDTITFTVANNPNAFHTVELLAPTFTPSQGYPGFAYRDQDNDPPPLTTTYFNSKPFFAASPSTLCGRGGNAPCVFNGSDATAMKSGVLVNPPPDGSGVGNPSFTLQLDPTTPPGTYFFVCLVHGPSMSGSIDVLPTSQPVQSADTLKADAARQYAADLDRLTELAKTIQAPEVYANPDGSRNWTVAAGGGSPDGDLSVNEFGVHDLFIRPGDNVTWTNQSPPIVAHTVTGFGTLPGQLPPQLSPYQPVCGGPDPNQNGATGPDTFYPPGSGKFAPDIWNDCLPWQQKDHLTDYAYPSAPSGSTYTDGSITSGLLLPDSFLSSSLGLGLPFSSSYTLTFPNAGTYYYTCAVHYGMVGTIQVVPTSIPAVAPTPTPTPGS